MITLQGNETLNIQCSTAVSVDVIASYVVHTDTTIQLSTAAVNLLTTANTEILTGGSTATVQVKGIWIRNRGVLTTEVTLKKNVAAVEYMVTAPIILRAGESLQYNDQTGFLLTDWNGRLRQSIPCGKQPASGIYYPVLFGAYAHTTSGSTATGARILDAAGTTVATYLGRAPKVTNRVLVKFRTCNTSVTATWGEIAVATGTPLLGAGTTLTVRGFNGSNNALANSLSSGTGTLVGTHSSYVNISPGQTIQEGDDVWILLGNQAVTGANVRCLAVADDLQTGLSLNAVTRPSLNIGKGVVYSLDAVANLSPYLSVSYL